MINKHMPMLSVTRNQVIKIKPRPVRQLAGKGLTTKSDNPSSQYPHGGRRDHLPHECMYSLSLLQENNKKTN